MKKSKWMLGAAAMLALSVALAGCGGSDKKADNKAAGVKGSLMVYTSIYPDIIDNMCKPNVAKAFPDMKVNWFQGGTEKVITKLIEKAISINHKSQEKPVTMQVAGFFFASIIFKKCPQLIENQLRM